MYCICACILVCVCGYESCRLRGSELTFTHLHKPMDTCGGRYTRTYCCNKTTTWQESNQRDVTVMRLCLGNAAKRKRPAKQIKVKYQTKVFLPSFPFHFTCLVFPTSIFELDACNSGLYQKQSSFFVKTLLLHLSVHNSTQSMLMMKMIRLFFSKSSVVFWQGTGPTDALDPPLQAGSGSVPEHQTEQLFDT